MLRFFLYSSLISLLVSCHSQQEKEPVAISRDGVNIAYTQCGKGDTTLLFVHGWCINKEYWQEQVTFFCSRYQVVTVDLPGFGQSGKNRTQWNFENYTTDIKEVIDRLKLKNVILIGHSMSGDIVLDAGNKYPSLLAGIVGIDNLHDPAGPFSEEGKKESDAFFSMLSSAFDSTVNQNMRNSLFRPATDTTIVNRVMADVTTTDSIIAINVLKAAFEILQKEKDMMRGLSHKLFLINSDAFPVNKDSLNKYCSKGFHTEILPGASHYPMIETPGAFNTALQRVIDEMKK